MHEQPFSSLEKSTGKKFTGGGKTTESGHVLFNNAHFN